jgi:tripartite-type tricarboxylate transporter receptor subunit TctC
MTSGEAIGRCVAVAASLAMWPYLVSPACAQAQTYPTRSIRFIVPYPPGGGTDTVARVVARRMAENIGQQIVIDNRGGANAIVGSQIAARSAPDGYTMVLGVPASLVVNPALYKDLPYDPPRDFVPVAQMTENAYLLTAHMGVPAATVKELVDLARAKPGQLNFGSSGNGSAGHLVLELLKRAAGVDIVHVPYKGGGPALNDLLGWQIQLMGGPMVAALPLVKARKVKALAVTTAKRISSMPDVPTVGETLPGYQSSGWAGVLMPQGTPGSIVTRLNSEIAKAVQDSEVRRQLGEQGSEPVTGTPAAFAALIARDTAAYQQLLKAAGMYKGGATQ